MSYETVTVVGTLLAVVVAVVVSNWAMLRGLRTELKRDIDGLRTELKTDTDGLRTEQQELNRRMEAMNSSLNIRIDSTNQRIDRLADALMVPAARAG